MTRSGDTIDNLRGEKIIFRRTESQFIEFDILLEPGAGEKEHLHPVLAEKFEVVSGIVRFKVDGYAFTSIAGEKFTVPANEWHAFENVGAHEARLRVIVEPAGKVESLYKTLFALAQSGELNAETGVPNILQMAVLLDEYRDELYTAPAFKLPMRALAIVARLLGYHAVHMYPFVRSTAELSALRLHTR